MDRWESAKILEKWIKKGGDKIALIKYLDYKSTSTLSNWLKRGIPPRVRLTLIKYILENEKHG